jgi:pimeloyl-ACP methyl ester carboxylesterase
MWFLQQKFFSNLYDFHSLDLLGAGNQQNETLFTLEEMCEHVENYIQTNRLHSPILAGLSMGGYVTLRILERSNIHFSGIVLMNTRSLPDSNTAKLKRTASIQKIRNVGIRSFLEEFIEFAFSPNSFQKNPGLREQILEIGTSQSSQGLISQLLAMQGRTDTTDFLSQIQTPTLILCGEKDTITTVSEMEQMAKLISHSQISVVPESGHFSPLENPEFVNSQILSFLESLEG